MKSAEETIVYLARRIGYLYYYRPLFYGGTAAGVELLLFTYHEVWSEIVGQGEMFQCICHEVGQEQDCGAFDFSTRYAMNHPGAAEEEISRYVVTHWRIISDRLGVPIPHAEMKAEFNELPGDVDD